MSKYLLIGLILFFLMMGGLVSIVFYENKTISGDEFYSTNPSLEQVLGTYWKASFEGNPKDVKYLTSFPPEDMFRECIGPKKNEKSEDTGLMPIKTEIIKDLSSPLTKANNYKNPFTSDEVPSLINFTSEFIYVNRIPFNKIKVLEKSVYQDEGMLEINILDYKGEMNPHNELVFFKKTREDWKIIGFGNKDMLPSISEKVNYAIPKPKCE